MRRADILLRALFVNVERASGSNVLVASTGSLPAMQSTKLGRSLFTQAVLEGWYLGKADGDANGVTVSELGAYVQSRVRACTLDLQVPNFRGENVAANFSLPRIPGDANWLQLPALHCSASTSAIGRQQQ